MLISIASLLLLIFGGVLTVGGAWLIALGGSWYYLITGIAFIATAVLLYRRSAAALWLYTAILIGTLIWAIWEAGLDWWSLAPRGGIIVLLALWLLLPGVRRQLPGSGGTALAVGVVAALVIAVYSMVVDARDLANTLPAGQSAEAPNLGDTVAAADWHHYGRTTYGQRYSPLTQITTGNAGSLTEVWRYRTGDIRSSADVPETTYQVTPIKVGDMLYLCTPHSIAIALDAATGQERWRFDPKVGLDKDRQHQTCRGVSYFASGASDQPCAERIFLPTSDARLIALAAKTGKTCPGFGGDGMVSLYEGMPYKEPGYYYSTSAPLVVAGKVIVGGAVNDDFSTQEPSGLIRAYDAVSGALVWNSDSGNPDKTTPIGPGEHYTANSPNM